MPLITLISDWLKQDHYLATVKAAILANSEQVSLVDISHQVSSFNLSQAAFILRNCWKHFPPNTVHLVCVNTESAQNTGVLAFTIGKQFFITADNGIAGILFDEEPELVIRIDKWKTINSFTVLDVFVPSACHLVNGGKLKDLGTPLKSWNKLKAIVPVVDESVVTGGVVYIDSYKNAITNITRELFDSIGKGRAFEIFVQSNHYKITQISKTYLETGSGELLALFNSSGLLEIAICNGNASDLLNLDTHSIVRLKFLK
jgi:S-adenosyl-L-methionine hydrolase (adenosine-forming)